jgi:hypothetical protein
MATKDKNQDPVLMRSQKKDKEQTKCSQHGILLNNFQQDFQNESAHEIVGIDILVGPLFALSIQFYPRSCPQYN